MNATWNWLQSYKVYILAAVGVVAAFGAWVNGSLDNTGFVAAILGGLTAITVQHGTVAQVTRAMAKRGMKL